MSIVSRESIEVIGQSIGITNLSLDAALTLAPDVEYRVREIMQEAVKCMRHSRRTILTTEDVDCALEMRNVEPLYGFLSGFPLRFRRALGYSDLFYVEDKELDFRDVIEAPLPKLPLDVSIFCHWLAIDGVQPVIPENAPVEDAPPSLEDVRTEQSNGLHVDFKLPVKHVLSKELQLYFNKITELAVNKSDQILFKQALVSLATDPGLHPLVPYFTCFVDDEVSHGLSDIPLLMALMHIVHSLIKNPHVNVEPYLHQLMPPVLSCLVSKGLGNTFADNHWELRDFTAKVVALICNRFGPAHIDFQTRLTKTLLHTFLDPKRSLTQHYGAIQGLSALGSNVIRILILPNMRPYYRLLEPELLLEKQKNEIKRHEAWRVYGALLRVAGKCIYDIIKALPVIPIASAHTFRSSNTVVTMNTSNLPKRGRSVDPEDQPSIKKTAIGGPLIDTDAVESSASCAPEEAASGHESGYGPQRDVTGRAVISGIWIENLKSGKFLESFFDIFGEAGLPFIPTPEKLLFL